MPPTRTSVFFRRLAGHTIAFGLSSLVRPLSQLLLVRLHTNTYFLTMEEYAAWTLFQVALNIGIAVFNIGLATAFFRFYLLASSDDEKQKVVSRSFRLTITISALGGLLLFGFSDLWTQWLVGRDVPNVAGTLRNLTSCGWWITLAVIGNTLTIIPLSLLRAEGRWKPFLAFNVIKFFALIGLNGVFLIYLGLGLEGVTLALAVTNISLAIIFIPFLRNYMFNEKWSAGWRTLLVYSVPLVATDVSYWILKSVGQVLLNAWSDARQVALYGFGLTLAAIAHVAVVMPFSIAFAPLLFRAKQEEEDPRPLYARTLAYIWLITLFTCLLITMFAPELASIFGKSVIYHDAVTFVGILVFTNVFYGVYFIFSSGAALKDKTWILPVILIATVAVEIIADWILIPRYHALGASWAMLAAYFILALLTLASNQFLYPIRIPWKRIFLPLVLMLVYIYLLFQTQLIDPLLWRIVASLLFPFVLVVTGYLDKGEWEALKRVLHR